MRLPSSETKRTPGPRHARQVRDHGRQRAAVADADKRRAAGLEHAVQPMPAGGGERGQRQRALVDCRGDGAELEAPARGDRLLERDALGGRALDEDMDEARADRLPDQPVDLDPRHAQPAGDLLLGLIAHVGEPCRTRGEAEFVLLQGPPWTAA